MIVAQTNAQVVHSRWELSMTKTFREVGIFCYLALFLTAPVASATFKDCWIYLTGKAQHTPIREQGIATKKTDDTEAARNWLWRENERNKSYAAGLNIAAPELVEFIISIKDWRDLTNSELRGILRVHNAFSVREFFEDTATPFAEFLKKCAATPEDLELWRVHLPGKPIPE